MASGAAVTALGELEPVWLQDHHLVLLVRLLILLLRRLASPSPPSDLGSACADDDDAWARIAPRKLRQQSRPRSGCALPPALVKHDAWGREQWSVGDQLVGKHHGSGWLDN
ncbi:hypothetical protein ABZP36_002526 [Zizania latifolia]